METNARDPGSPCLRIQADRSGQKLGGHMSALREQIQATLDEVARAWAAGDGQALAAAFVEDGSLVNPFGQRAEGRAAIAAMYREYFAGMLRGSTTRFDVTHARKVESRHAFADGNQSILGPDGSEVLVVRIAALLRREGERWLWVDSRPYKVAEVPR